MKRLFVTLVVALLLSVGAVCAAPLQADLNRNGIVDFNDFAVMANEWLQVEDGNNITVLRDHSYYYTDGSLALFGATTWKCMSFVATNSYSAGGVKLRVCQSNGQGIYNPGNVTVSLQNANTQTLFPTGEILGSVVIDGNSFPLSTPDSGLSDARKIVVAPYVPLVVGNTYSIVISAENVDSMYIYRNDYFDNRFFGLAGTSFDGGITWVGDIYVNTQFAIYSLGN